MKRVFLALSALLLSGCGFRPLYATEGGGGSGLSRMALVEVTANETIAPVISRAFERRMTRNGADALYDLTVRANEQAQQLAVQIDASVTRYNYNLNADYTLTERSTGKRYTGRVVSIASFNIVDSQYSTLYAEETAREKAAAQLVEDIERDALLKIAAEKQ
jgi:LPS-assembly lipoprotein